MNRILTLIASLAIGATSALAGNSHDVPPAVQDSLKLNYPSGTFRLHEAESENGVRVYEMVTGTGADAVKVGIAADGTRVEEESKITAAALPEAVRTALKAQAGEAEIRSLVKIVTYAVPQKGKAVTAATPITTYEAKWRDGHTRREQEFDATGKKVQDDDATNGADDEDDDGDDD